MPTIERWECEIEPVSGWEIRSQTQQGMLEVMDARVSQERVVTQQAGNISTVVRYRGRPTGRNRSAFDIPILNPVEPRMWFDQNNWLMRTAYCRSIGNE